MNKRFFAFAATKALCVLIVLLNLLFNAYPPVTIILSAILALESFSWIFILGFRRRGLAFFDLDFTRNLDRFAVLLYLWIPYVWIYGIYKSDQDNIKIFILLFMFFIVSNIATTLIVGCILACGIDGVDRDVPANGDYSPIANRQTNFVNEHILYDTYIRDPRSCNHDECVICLDVLNDYESVAITECLHKFHARCLTKWLSRYSNTCPACRARLENKSPV